MLTYVLRRVLQTVPVLIGITLISFLLLGATRGAALQALGPRSSASDREAMRRRMGLDRSVLGRYWIYLVGGQLGDVNTRGLVRGDMGRTLQHNRPVSRVVFSAFLVTLRLALGAVAVAVTLGVAAGVAGALKPYGVLDAAAMLLALVGVSVPVFWLGQIFHYVFAVQLGWTSVTHTGSTTWQALVLPSLALGLVTTAVIARLTRSTMLDTAGQDYVRTARAKGLSRARAVVRHAFANAVIPVLTVIANNLGSLLAGAVLTETVFALDGLGKVIVDAVSAREYSLLTGALVTVSAVFVLVNLAADIAYAYLDPRIRCAQGGS